MYRSQYVFVFASLTLLCRKRTTPGDTFGLFMNSVLVEQHLMVALVMLQLVHGKPLLLRMLQLSLLELEAHLQCSKFYQQRSVVF